MTNIRRVHLNWTGDAVTGVAGTNFYFLDSVGSNQQCVDAIADFMVELDAHLCGTLSWATDAQVDHIDIATGEVQSSEGTTPTTGTGSGTGACLPMATQGLIRARTGAYINGREVRGRWFIPGFTEGESDLGRPVQGALDAMQNAVNALISSEEVSPIVWTKTHGTAAAILSGGPWSEWAVMRSRRD